MRRPTRQIPIWLLAFVASVSLFLAAPIQATDFDRFRRMNAQEQAEYVAVMIDAAENALRTANRADLAAKVHELFTHVLPGDSMPLGLFEYGEIEGQARLRDAERLAKDPNAGRIEVEHALFVTLDRNNMKLSVSEGRSVFDRMRGFHPMTYAEFKAKTPDEQRKFIALLARLAYPDFKIRYAVEGKLAGKPSSSVDTPEARQRERAVVAAQFPSGAVIQPGFPRLAREIDIAYRKDPTDTVFYSFILNVFDLMEEEYSQEMKRLEDSTLHIP